MSTTAVAILGLIGWYIIILFTLAAVRAYLTLTGKKAANTFAPDGTDLPGFGQRVTRVHANCYENIPFFLAILLYARISDAEAITDPTALWLLAARVAQSVTHLISTSVPAVMIRFFFFIIQIGLLICWLWQLIW